MQVVLHPEAAAEALAAAWWYEERQPGLGGEFIAEVTAVLQRIEGAPDSFPRWPATTGAGKPIRRAVMQRFPYLVAFEGHRDHILILAVAHGKRRPLYWLVRATP